MLVMSMLVFIGVFAIGNPIDVMLAPDATRMGIATAYAPNSKYRVYWALLVSK